MPRRSRLMLPGVPVHIVHRGNNKQPCFREEQDKTFYLVHLARLLRQTGCALHAYCLMTNHVHFLVSSKASGSCSRLMKGIAQLHTQYINRTYGRSGTLWEGRFRSCLVQTEEYVLACYRYIEANPVRAGLCHHPGDYPWSSYGHNADGANDPLVTPHDEYMRLACDADSRRSNYRELFESLLPAGKLDEIRKATNGNFVLGDASFRAELEARTGRRVAPGSPGRPARSMQKGEHLDLLEP
jgi:putative transposase